MSRFVVLFTISIALTLIACRPPANPTNPSAVNEILGRLEETASRIKDIKGSADVVAFINNQRGRAGVRIRFIAPDRYRIDIHAGVMQVIAVILLDGDSVKLYTPRENTLYEGRLLDQDVLVPGLLIPLADIRTAAVGMIKLQPYLDGPITDYRYENGDALISIQKEGLTRTIWVDVQKSVVIREEEQHSNGFKVSRAFLKYNKRKGIWRPGRIQILSDRQEASMDLVYNTQSTNGGLTHADLSVRFPSSVIRRSLKEINSFVD